MVLYSPAAQGLRAVHWDALADMVAVGGDKGGLWVFRISGAPDSEVPSDRPHFPLLEPVCACSVAVFKKKLIHPKYSTGGFPLISFTHTCIYLI
jgi:hypothetical protein